MRRLNEVLKESINESGELNQLIKLFKAYDGVGKVLPNDKLYELLLKLSPADQIKALDTRSKISKEYNLGVGLDKFIKKDEPRLSKEDNIYYKDNKSEIIDIIKDFNKGNINDNSTNKRSSRRV